MIASGDISEQLPLKPSESERRWVFGFAALIILMTMLPYILGYQFAGEMHFTGAVIGVEDMNSYIAKMLNGSYGEWLFRTPYTAYPQKGVLMFLPYILLGKLAGGPAIHEQLVAIYHLFRVIAGFMMIYATYDFIAFFISRVGIRRFGLIMAILGGGLGWLLVIFDQWLGNLPLEFYSPESFGFLSLFGFPHLAAGRALLLWTLLAYLQQVRYTDLTSPLWRRAGKISALWLLGGLMQPLIALVIGAVILLHLVGLSFWSYWRYRVGISVDWDFFRRLIILVVFSGILPSLFVLYNAVSVFIDPFLQLWTSQNYLPSPHPLHYLSAYILILPYAFFGARRLLRTDFWFGWMLVGWSLALPILAYLPVGLQRRFPEGIWVALVVLSMAALDRPKVSRYYHYPLSLAFLSTLFIYLGGIVVVLKPGQPVYRPADEVAVFEFLRESADKNEVVLSAYDTGNALPAWAPLHVVLGHGPESVQFDSLAPRIDEFYSSAGNDLERRSLLSDYGVDYVFWGPAERALGVWDPQQESYLRRFYQVGEYSVFEVINISP